jgi:hypothetical protein
MSRSARAEGFDEARMAAVASGEREILAEFWPAMIEDGAIVAAGFLADGTGQPALADAGRADQGQIVAGVDPFALGELLEQGAVETPGGMIIDIFDARLLTQFGGAQPRREAFVPPPGRFPVEEQGEPVGVRQILCVAGGGEIGESLGSAAASTRAAPKEPARRTMPRQAR